MLFESEDMLVLDNENDGISFFNLFLICFDGDDRNLFVDWVDEGYDSEC